MLLAIELIGAAMVLMCLFLGARAILSKMFYVPTSSEIKAQEKADRTTGLDESTLEENSNNGT